MTPGRFPALLLLGLILTVAAGCSSGPVHAPVDAAKARETLRAALDSWKKGEPSDALQKADPAIYVIDNEWQEGGKLVDYRITGDGEEKDAHLFCPVNLTVREPSGKVGKRDVIYIISTAPKLTVSRKLF
jgi:hypothetical protein